MDWLTKLYNRKIFPQTKFTWLETHHFYWGIILILIGFILLFYLNINTWYSQLLFILGIWFILDDWLQHSIQKKEIKKKGYYETVTFWHWFPYQVLNWIKSKKIKSF